MDKSIMLHKLHDLFDEGRFVDIVMAAEGLLKDEEPEIREMALLLTALSQFQTKSYELSHKSFQDLCGAFEVPSNFFYLATSYLPLSDLATAEATFNQALQALRNHQPPNATLNQYQGYFMYIRALMDFGFRKEALQRFFEIDEIYRGIDARRTSELYYSGVPSFREFFDVGESVFRQAGSPTDRQGWILAWQEVFTRRKDEVHLRMLEDVVLRFRKGI